MNTIITIKVDTATGAATMESKPPIPPDVLAVVLAQATVQSLMMDQRNRSLLINPLAGGNS